MTSIFAHHRIVFLWVLAALALTTSSDFKVWFCSLILMVGGFLISSEPSKK